MTQPTADLEAQLARAQRTYHNARCCGDMARQIGAATDISLLTYRINQLAQERHEHDEDFRRDRPR
jgi:hypothetical protein